MSKKPESKKLTLAAMFLAMALLMPFLTGQIPQVGSMLCPMHIPVILCGFFCGGFWGLIVGFVAPLLRSAMFGMPPMFPVAICMAFELAVYGLVAGTLYGMLPKKKGAIYGALLCAMVLGRVVWGIAMKICVGAQFGMAAFLSGAVMTAIPGIVLQLITIPVVVIMLEKYTK